jgi:hypothetical protein
MKAIKAKLVYPSSSKLPEQFKNELVQKATVVFKEVEALVYKISSNTVEYSDHIVYESSGRNENFAHVFFKDGIINLSFHDIVSENELERFIYLAAKMMRTVFVDDDLATLLWEENFQGITYELIDDGLEIDTIEYTPDRLKSDSNVTVDDIQSLYLDESEITFDDEDFAQADVELNLRNRGKAFAAMTEESYSFLNHIAEFTKEENEQIAATVELDSHFDHVEYILTVIFEILGMEKELPGYTETLKFIGKVRDNFINLGNFAGAAALLTRMKEIQSVLKNMNTARAEKIDGFFVESATNEKISLITEVANKIKDMDSKGLLDYLLQLPWAAIDPLISALGELKYFKSRQTVCNALAELGKDQIDLVARGLEDERWYVVRNIVSVLGQIGNSRVLNYLKKTIRHPDYRVRSETLAAAASIKQGDNSDFMILALSDPDTKIQLSSLQFLIDNKCHRAFKPLEYIINDKKFKDRSSEQIRKFIEGYAQLGQEKSMPMLKQLALKRSFLSTIKDERLKFMAIGALGMVNSAEAAKVLNKLSKSKNKKISAAAMRAITAPKGKS